MYDGDNIFFITIKEMNEKQNLIIIFFLFLNHQKHKTTDLIAQDMMQFPSKAGFG